MAKAKSPKKEILPLKDRAIRAALDLAAEKGWAETTLSDIGARCKCKLSALNAIFSDRDDILAAYGRQVDQMVMDRVSIDTGSTERDRIFDVIMERFDILNGDRASLLSILKSFRRDPKKICVTLPYLGRSMSWMLEAAGIEANGRRGRVKACGLAGVYLYTMKAWIEDDSADMSKTMAALDKALGRIEKVAQFIDRGA